MKYRVLMNRDRKTILITQKEELHNYSDSNPDLYMGLELDCYCGVLDVFHLCSIRCGAALT